jgi:hypothetical protein
MLLSAELSNGGIYLLKGETNSMYALPFICSELLSDAASSSVMGTHSPNPRY